MTPLHWLLKALRCLFHNNALRVSSRAILSLWNLLKVRLKKANGTSGKGGRKAQDEPEPTIHILYSSESKNVVKVPNAETSVICPSHDPDSLQPFPPGASPSHSSHDLSTFSLHPDDIPRSRTPSRPRIAYPNVSGHLYGSPSVSRTSIAGYSFGDSSRAPSPASSRPVSLVQVALPITQTPVPSHSSASHVSIADSFVTHDDSPRITIRRETGAPAGGEQGCDISITTSPVQDDTSTAENLSNVPSSTFGTLYDIHPHFWPEPPELNDRYHRTETVLVSQPSFSTFSLTGIIYSSTDPTEYLIKPLTTHFRQEDPKGWERIPHPEGARYFWFQEKNVYTDANILDERVRGKVAGFIKEIFDFCDKYKIRLPPAANLVLAPKIGDNGEVICAYYFVDHSRRSIFWLDHFMFSDSKFYICETVRGVTDPSHIRHEIESQYWYHCNLYPHSSGLTPVLVDELRDIIMHWISDSLTSAIGTAPYSVAELQSMLNLANNFRKNTTTGGCVSAYSRLMNVFCRHRFIYFHGQPAVRLDFDKSVHETPDVPMQSWLLKLLSPLMFSTPDIYYNALDRIWVDRMIHQASWDRFINGMKDEWQELILFGTVLLNANVAFLAIQSIDTDQPQRSPAQISSYTSVVVTLGSIILGLFLARKHRVKPKESAEDAAVFLHSWSSEEHGRSGVRIGLETLAILYSVPYALLMWGVILFLVGFSYMCFNDTNVAVRSLTGGAWLATFIFVLWCILSLASWHQAQRKSFWQSIFVWIRWVFFDLPKKIKSFSPRDFFFRASNDSQSQMNEMHERVVESPQEMQDQDISSIGPHSSSSNCLRGGHQSEGGPMRHILSFFGRRRSCQDTTPTSV
ncbi:hypothetical protein VKT23_019638 [Stygiomarasmius scandens]|uniref:Uncharacterized protein n=1 Tax=Marasmiellus scandens TaxID=2682957 RepID=A0ABR1IKW9_9AGAR